jgi:hypothetical protein
VSPLKDQITTQQELVAKIICKINSQAFIKAINYLINNPFGSKEDYWNLNKLRNIVPNHVLSFGNDLTNTRKFNRLILLISYYYKVEDMRAVTELFNFINFCEVLEDKVDQGQLKVIRHPWIRQDVNYMDKINSLFDVYEFNRRTYHKNKEIREATRSQYEKMTKEIQHRGLVVLKKHL